MKNSSPIARQYAQQGYSQECPLIDMHCHRLDKKTPLLNLWIVRFLVSSISDQKKFLAAFLAARRLPESAMKSSMPPLASSSSPPNIR